MNIKKRYHSLSLPAKATIWFTVCNFILGGIGFITGPIFTRLLPSDEYGMLSVFMSYDQLILILATWEIQTGAYQKGIFKYKDDVEFYTTSTQALINLITIVLFIILFSFRSLTIRITGMNNTLLALLFVYLILRPAYNAWLIRKRKSYDYKAGVSITLLYSIANVIIPMIAILLIGRTANVKFAFTLIASSLISFIIFVRHADYWRIPKHWNLTRSYWKFNIIFQGPLVLHSLSYLVLSQADRVMINEMIGSSQAAFYSVAYSIASVVTLFQSSINTSLSPWRFQMLEEKKYSSIKDVTNKLILAMAGIIILFILVVPEMMKLLFTSDYYEAVWCIPPISTGVFFMFLYSIFVNVEEYYEQTKYVLLVSVTCGVINIALNYFFIGIFGYIACAYTTLFSYVLFAIGHYVFMRIIMKNKNISEKVVDGRFILLVSSGLIISSVVITVLYDCVWIRYGIFVVSLLIAFINRKRIIAVFRQMKGETK